MGEQSEQLAGGAQGGGRVPRAEGMAAPAPVRTSQMEFEAMTRRAGQGYGGYAPHAPLLAVRPKQLSVRREDVLCRRAFHSTDSHAALEALDGAICIAPRHFKAIFNRAVTRLHADSAHSHDAKLRRDLDLALELSGRDVHVLCNRAVASQMRGDYAGAIEDLDEAIARSPRSACFYLNRALAHRKRSDWAASIRDYEMARRLSEENDGEGGDEGGGEGGGEGGCEGGDEGSGEGSEGGGEGGMASDDARSEAGWAGSQPPDATRRGGEGGASAQKGGELRATAMVAAWGARARMSRRRTLQGSEIDPQIVAAACAPAAARSAAQLEVPVALARLSFFSGTPRLAPPTLSPIPQQLAPLSISLTGTELASRVTRRARRRPRRAERRGAAGALPHAGL